MDGRASEIVSRLPIAAAMAVSEASRNGAIVTTDGHRLFVDVRKDRADLIHQLFVAGFLHTARHERTASFFWWYAHDE